MAILRSESGLNAAYFKEALSFNAKMHLVKVARVKLKLTVASAGRKKNR